MRIRLHSHSGASACTRWPLVECLNDVTALHHQNGWTECADVGASECKLSVIWMTALNTAPVGGWVVTDYRRVLETVRQTAVTWQDDNISTTSSVLCRRLHGLHCWQWLVMSMACFRHLAARQRQSFYRCLCSSQIPFSECRGRISVGSAGLCESNVSVRLSVCHTLV